MEWTSFDVGPGLTVRGTVVGFRGHTANDCLCQRFVQLRTVLENIRRSFRIVR